MIRQNIEEAKGKNQKEEAKMIRQNIEEAKGKNQKEEAKMKKIKFWEQEAKEAKRALRVINLQIGNSSKMADLRLLEQRNGELAWMLNEAGNEEEAETFLRRAEYYKNLQEEAKDKNIEEAEDKNIEEAKDKNIEEAEDKNIEEAEDKNIEEAEDILQEEAKMIRQNIEEAKAKKLQEEAKMIRQNIEEAKAKKLQEEAKMIRQKNIEEEILFNIKFTEYDIEDIEADGYDPLEEAELKIWEIKDTLEDLSTFLLLEDLTEEDLSEGVKNKISALRRREEEVNLELAYWREERGIFVWRI